MNALLELENKLHAQLANGRVAYGIFLLSASPLVAEACGTMGFDWALIDCEAAPVGRIELLQLMQALTGSSATPLVRTQGSTRPEIEHALDLGAHGILVPKVNSEEQARAVVDAFYYPPLGTRGINPIRASGYFTQVADYLRAANERSLCMVQIETVEAVENVDRIAGVPGVDVLFVGPGDLASSLGQPGNPTGPAMEKARARVVEAARKHGKIAGIFGYSPELARQHADEGFQLISLANDFLLLRRGVADFVTAVKHREIQR